MSTGSSRRPDFAVISWPSSPRATLVVVNGVQIGYRGGDLTWKYGDGRVIRSDMADETSQAVPPDATDQQEGPAHKESPPAAGIPRVEFNNSVPSPAAVAAIAQTGIGVVDFAARSFFEEKKAERKERVESAERAADFAKLQTDALQIRENARLKEVEAKEETARALIRERAATRRLQVEENGKTERADAIALWRARADYAKAMSANQSNEKIEAERTRRVLIPFGVIALIVLVVALFWALKGTPQTLALVATAMAGSASTVAAWARSGPATTTVTPAREPTRPPPGPRATLPPANPATPPAPGTDGGV